MKKTFFNARLVLPWGVRSGGIVVDGSKIENVFFHDAYLREGELIDCKNNYLSPGFIDLHTHGTNAGDTMDATVESLHGMAKVHARHGTTALLATTLSQSHARILAAVHNVKEVMRLPPVGTRILGVHLESNYFAPQMAGAQNPEYLYAPREEDYMPYVETGCIRRISAAPELPGALEMAKKLRREGIQFSIAHSNGRPGDVHNAILAGYTSLTHIFNAQSALSSVFFYPEFGVSETSLLYDEMRVECICDNNHLSPTILKLIYKIKGADGMIGVTDSVFAGAPDGNYQMGGVDVKVQNNICILRDDSAFAGSVATMDLCVRTLHHAAGIPLHDAVAICTFTPAKVIGMQDTMGVLSEGYVADINIFDENINILYTLIQGGEFQNRL